MKKIIYFIFILFSFSCINDKNQKEATSKEKNNKETPVTKKRDSVFTKRKVIKKIINTDHLKIGEILKYDIYKDTIYSFYQNKILKIDTISLSLNQFSLDSSLFAKSKGIINYDYIFNIKINKNFYQLVNYNSVINYDNDKKMIEDVYFTDNVVFSTLKEDYSIICDYNKVSLLNDRLILLDEMKFDFIDNFFIKSDKNRFFYCEDYSDNLIEFLITKNKISLHKRKPLSEITGIENFENFNIELITDRYIIGTYYDDYSNIFFINRENYTFEGKVYIGEEFKYSNNYSNEYLQSKFQIIYRDDKYYFLGLSINDDLIIGAII